MFWLFDLQNYTDFKKRKKSLKDCIKNSSRMNLLTFNTKSNHYWQAAISIYTFGLSTVRVWYATDTLLCVLKESKPYEYTDSSCFSAMILRQTASSRAKSCILLALFQPPWCLINKMDWHFRKFVSDLIFRKINTWITKQYWKINF